MALGPGKYDGALTVALSLVGAQQGVLIVLDGVGGVGFSTQADLQALSMLPGVLEQMAGHIRKDIEAIVNGQADPA